MRFDVVPVARLANTGKSEHSVDVSGEVRVVENASQIALEMDNVHQIKPNERWEQADIGFREHTGALSDQPVPSLEVGLKLVQSLEKGVDGGVVGRLGSCKPGLVNAVVDRFVVGVDHLVDVVLQVFGTQGCPVSETCVRQHREHTDDFSALVVDDGVQLFVPKNGNGSHLSTPGPTLKGPVVNAFQTLLVVKGVLGRSWLSGIERPRTVRFHSPINDIVRDAVFQSQEESCEKGPMGPWASVGDVEMVAFGLRREQAVGHEEIAKFALLSDK